MGVVYNKSQEIQIKEKEKEPKIQVLKYRNTNCRNTEIHITDIKQFKLQI